MKKIRAIKIDVDKKQVSVINIEPTLEALYEVIGCETIEKINALPRHHLLCDEEGKIQIPQKKKFRLVGFPIVGNALLVGISPDGSHWVSCTADLSEIKYLTRFL